MNHLLETALAYAADGLPVLPLFEPRDDACACGDKGCGSPGKHPRTRHGLKDASTDPGRIREWWHRWPTSNVGLRTGRVGGLIAVDLDSLEGELRLSDLAGIATIDALLNPAELGGLIVNTGRGYQVWYRAPDGLRIMNSAGKLGPGIDVRGEGGYVVAPPSVHANGRRYAFGGGHFDPPPSWLLEQIADPEQAQPPAQAPTATAGDETVDENDRQLDTLFDTLLARRYGAALLAARCNAVRAAAEGGRNYALLRAATTVGGYIATGAIEEAHARRSA
jgi:hypothetical protein